MLERIIVNWPLKLLALALAFAIWASVTGEKPIARDFATPLELTLPATRTLAVDPPNTVTVRLRGSESLMGRLDRAPMQLSVDLTDAPLGAREVLLSKSDLTGVPRGVNVEFVDPERLSLTIDRLESREFKVEPNFLGQPPEGFAFYSARVTPESVIVAGPEAEINGMTRLPTRPIRLDQRTAPFTISVAADTEGRNVRISPATPLQIRVDVDTSPVEKRYPGILVLAEGLEYASSFVPDSVDVTLSGPQALLDGMDSEQIHVFATIADLGPGEEGQTVPVRVELAGVPEDQLPRISVKSLSHRDVVASISDRSLTP